MVVGRATVGVVGAPLLVDLRERRLDEAEAPPSVAMTHIQKTEPAPPRVTAVATPAMLPTPTREAVETISARKEETAAFLLRGLHDDGGALR